MSAWRGWAWLLALLTFVFGAAPDLTRTTMHSSTATPTTTSGTRSAPPTTTGRATTSASTTSAAPAPPPATSRSASAFRSRIDPVTAEQLAGSYHQGCPVEPSALRMLTVSYIGFDGQSHTGRLVVAADWAARLAGVFATLYREKFAIRSMQPVTAYGASDDASMAADNSSAFNCRAVTGGSSFSEHSYGTAIDLNPVENPYVSGTLVEPDAGADYLDRSDVRPGMVTADGPVVAAFAAIGWSWGGSWSSPTDYQHFSASGR